MKLDRAVRRDEQKLTPELSHCVSDNLAQHRAQKISSLHKSAELSLHQRTAPAGSRSHNPTSITTQSMTGPPAGAAHRQHGETLMHRLLCLITLALTAPALAFTDTPAMKDDLSTAPIVQPAPDVSKEDGSDAKPADAQQ